MHIKFQCIKDQRLPKGLQEGFILLTTGAMKSLAAKQHEANGKLRASLGAKLTVCKKTTHC